MTTRQGSYSHTEQDGRIGVGPRDAYWMDDGAGHLILGTGDREDEAVAFWNNTSGNTFELDDDPDAEDRRMRLVDSNVVIL